MIHPILAYGEPILKLKASKISLEETNDLDPLINDLWETMYNANGVGIAAPQIGISKAIFVADFSFFKEEENFKEDELINMQQVFINPEIINGRLFGRGSGDNKAGVVIHHEVVKELMKDLPVNIKIFIEGEEEIGSPCMAQFLDEFNKELEADVIVIADSGNIRIGTPTVTTSLRGLVDGFIEVDQPMRPVHSGVGGGVVPDAFMVLSKIIASFHNEKGELQIEGLTSSDMDVLELKEEEIKKIFGSEDINLFELDSISKRLWLEPALSILAIDAPSTKEAVNLVIPNAKAKVSLRLPPTEDPEHAMKMLEEHIMKNVPWGANVRFIPEAKGSGIVADPNKEFTKKLVQNFEEVFNKAQADGALAAGIFHRGELTIPALKKELANLGVNVRI